MSPRNVKLPPYRDHCRERTTLRATRSPTEPPRRWGHGERPRRTRDPRGPGRGIRRSPTLPVDLGTRDEIVSGPVTAGGVQGAAQALQRRRRRATTRRCRASLQASISARRRASQCGSASVGSPRRERASTRASHKIIVTTVGPGCPPTAGCSLSERPTACQWRAITARSQCSEAPWQAVPSAAAGRPAHRLRRPTIEPAPTRQSSRAAMSSRRRCS